MLPALLALLLAAQPSAPQVLGLSTGSMKMLALPAPLRVARSSDPAVLVRGVAPRQVLLVGARRGVAEVTCELEDGALLVYVVRVDWGQSTEVLEEVDRAVGGAAPHSPRLRSGFAGQDVALRGLAATEEEREAVRRLIPSLRAQTQREVRDELQLEPPTPPRPAGVVLEGRVAVTGDAPVGETPLRLEDDAEVRLGRTDASGLFRFEGVRPGPWKVIVEPTPTHLAATLPLQVPRTEPLLFLVQPAEELKGRVVGEDGLPVDGAELTARCGTSSARATSDAVGAFALSGLAHGECTVEAHRSGCAATSLKLRSGAYTSVTLRCGWTATGQVATAAGEAPTGCATLLFDLTRPPKPVEPAVTVDPSRHPTKRDLERLRQAFRFATLQTLLPLRGVPLMSALARDHLGLDARLEADGAFRLEHLAKRRHRLVVACDQGQLSVEFLPRALGRLPLLPGAAVTLEAPGGAGPWRFFAIRDDALIVQSGPVATPGHAFPNLPPGRWLFAASEGIASAPGSPETGPRVSLGEATLVRGKAVQVTLQTPPELAAP